MGPAAFLFFFTGAVFFCGGVFYIGQYRRPGMYPPKFLMKKRAAALAAGAGIAFLLGCFIIWMK